MQTSSKFKLVRFIRQKSFPLCVLYYSTRIFHLLFCVCFRFTQCNKQVRVLVPVLVCGGSDCSGPRPSYANNNTVRGWEGATGKWYGM